MDHLLVAIAAKIGPFLASGAGKLLLTQAGAAALIALIGRYLPEKKLYDLCYGFGKLLSATADIRLGRPFWEAFENFIEKFISVASKGLFDGWNSDDNPVVVAPAQVPPDNSAAVLPPSNSGTPQ